MIANKNWRENELVGACDNEGLLAVIRHRAVRYANNIHYSGQTDEMPSPYVVEIALLEAMVAELKEYKDHACVFGEEDYCHTCGIDGRA